MPQSVSTLLNAPPAPPKNLPIPTPPKPPTAAESSFHAALNQIKNKPKAPSTAPQKPTASAKPQAHKPAVLSKKAKPLSAKSADTKPPKPTAPKPRPDDATDRSHDSDADSKDPATDAEHDPSADADVVHDSPDADDATPSPATAQLHLAAQQAATANMPLADSTDDAKDAHDKSDHADKKDSDSAASSSDAATDPATVNGQLTAQAVTAVKQTTDQPDQKDSPSDQSETPAQAPVAPATSEPASSPKAHARAAQADKNQNSDPTAQSPDAASAQTSAQPTAAPTDTRATPSPKNSAKSVDDVLSKSSNIQGLITQSAASKADTARAASAPQAPDHPEARFAQANHPTIVSEIQGKLLPTGGSMDIHLTPQDLGSVHVRVEVRDGSITATFAAADNDTAKLLTHSLTDLKSSLEAQGIAVEKLHVTHTPNPKDQSPSHNNTNSRRDPDPHQQQAFHQDQHRRDMLRRLWRRAMKTPDPLDLVA